MYDAEANRRCWGSLYARDGQTDAYHLQWRNALVNDIAPHSAFVSNDGKFVATTDEYGRLGHGNNVVVIYNEEGEVVRKFALSAFLTLSANDTERVPETQKSIWWGGAHRINSQKGVLELEVWDSGDPFDPVSVGPVKYRKVWISLSGGEILDGSEIP